jgi:hypothetical protein
VSDSESALIAVNIRIGCSHTIFIITDMTECEVTVLFYVSPACPCLYEITGGGCYKSIVYLILKSLPNKYYIAMMSVIIEQAMFHQNKNILIVTSNRI